MHSSSQARRMRRSCARAARRTRAACASSTPPPSGWRRTRRTPSPTCRSPSNPASEWPHSLFFSILRLLLLALLAFTATPVGREEGTLSLKKSKHYGLHVYKNSIKSRIYHSSWDTYSLVTEGQTDVQTDSAVLLIGFRFALSVL